MHDYQPYSITGFHSCDRTVGLSVLNGADKLQPSNNRWDWLGNGIYFWEQNPMRALEYAEENAAGTQFNKNRVSTPFVLGALVELGNCLNLVESGSLKILSTAFEDLKAIVTQSGREMPMNRGANRTLDCAVIQYIHKTHAAAGGRAYDTVRCAFQEGDEAYEGATITSRLHIQVCVLNPDCIKGYFLPQPIEKYNPHLRPEGFVMW